MRRRDTEAASTQLWRLAAVTTLGTAVIGEAAGAALTAGYSWRFADGTPLGLLVGGAIDAGIGAVALISAAHHDRQATAYAEALRTVQLSE